jgi:acyl-coenzyme A synthetase/AMP-(fatty) acid ligase
MIIDRIYDWAHIQPDKAAIIQHEVVVNYATFARAIERTRRHLERLQLPRGSTAAILINNLTNCWVVSIALRAAGLNTLAVANAGRAQQLHMRDLSCFVSIENETHIHDLTSPHGIAARLIVIPMEIYADTDRGELPAPPEANAPYGGHILYTSGTTGSYKKILMPSHQEDARNKRRAEILLIDKEAVWNGLAFHLGTGGGYKQPCAVWHQGACMVFDQSDNWPDNLFRFNVSRIYLVPVQIRTLFAARPASSANDTMHQSTVISVSSGFLAPELAERIVRELTSRLVIQYSATELIDVPLEAWYATNDDLIWLNIVNDCNVEIIDEFGRECPPLQEGQIRIRQKEIDVSSYMDDDDASRRVFHDGYFYPGDMAVKRADGRIRVLGRVDDVVNIQGGKVAVAPIEQELQRYFQADEVCIFGHADDAGREELIIAIQSPSAPPQAKLDDIRKRFDFFDTVRFAVMAKFPRTESGTNKVRRARLRSLLTRGR